MLTFKTLGFALVILGALVLALGSGMSDGIGGHVPNEGGSRLVGGLMAAVGVALLAVHLARARRDNDRRPPEA